MVSLHRVFSIPQSRFNVLSSALDPEMLTQRGKDRQLDRLFPL